MRATRSPGRAPNSFNFCAASQWALTCLGMANASEAAYLSVFMAVTSRAARTMATATRLVATDGALKLLVKAATHKMTRNGATYLPSTSTLVNARHAAAAGNQRNHWRHVTAIHSLARRLQKTSAPRATTYSTWVSKMEKKVPAD